jgi:hypothetical protein
MGRPPGKTFPISVMVKTTAPMKARLEALAARTPFDVSVGFSVVARRAIAIGLEVLERDPRLIMEPLDGDASAALEVLRTAADSAVASTLRRIEEARANHPDAIDDPSLAAIEAVWSVLGVLPPQNAPGEATSTDAVPSPPDGTKGPPRGAQGER